MPIPKSRAEAICLSVLTVFGICCVLIAMVNLCCGVLLIASFLWLALVAAMLWTAAREVVAVGTAHEASA